jgi:hypothetical protein
VQLLRFLPWAVLKAATSSTPAATWEVKRVSGRAGTMYLDNAPLLE